MAKRKESAEARRKAEEEARAKAEADAKRRAEEATRIWTKAKTTPVDDEVRERILRVFAMTSSSFDGEALAALRKVQELAQQHGTTLDAILR